MMCSSSLVVVFVILPVGGEIEWFQFQFDSMGFLKMKNEKMLSDQRFDGFVRVNVVGEVGVGEECLSSSADRESFTQVLKACLDSGCP